MHSGPHGVNADGLASTLDRDSSGEFGVPVENFEIHDPTAELSSLVDEMQTQGARSVALDVDVPESDNGPHDVREFSRLWFPIDEVSDRP